MLIDHLPIVVDLDGTLTATNTLVESIIKFIKQSSLNALRLLWWLLTKNRAVIKKYVASHVNISAENLPYNKPLLAYLREEKEKGRKIILATAAHQSIAEEVSRHLGLFDKVLATTEGNNLKRKVKLLAIEKAVGKEFVYAGNSQSDIPIWKAAKAAILVGVTPHVAETIRREIPIEKEFHKEISNYGTWFHALRVHQWAKNLLLFVPFLTSFSFMEIGKLSTMIMAFMSFSFAASANYIINDISDMENDRMHPRKRRRPFASAKLPILYGLAVAGGFTVLAFIMAFAVSNGFVLVLFFYLMISNAYNWVLKELVLIDVIVLSLLYTLRILAGSMAVEVATSPWLFAFSVFVFLSLALVKRNGELVSLEKEGMSATVGRDYHITDLRVLWPLGVGTAISAVVIFGLFISAPETQTRYSTPQILWVVDIGLIYWLGRLWIKTSRGEMHDDPIVYAIKDRTSRLTVFCMLVVVLIAHYLKFD